MMDEIEELWALAEECRGWEVQMRRRSQAADEQAANQFRRLFVKLDEIARRLAARLPT
jgi:hypothetical protein